MKRLAQIWLEITLLSKVTTTAPPQLSLVVTAVVLAAGTNPAQETVTLAGQVMLGGVWSKTVIVCAQLAVLPQASVANKSG